MRVCLCESQSGGSIACVPRAGLGFKQVSFCRAELVQVFLFVTNNLSESSFVGNKERGDKGKRETGTQRGRARSSKVCILKEFMLLWVNDLFLLFACTALYKHWDAIQAHQDQTVHFGINHCSVLFCRFLYAHWVYQPDTMAHSLSFLFIYHKGHANKTVIQVVVGRIAS